MKKILQTIVLMSALAVAFGVVSTPKASAEMFVSDSMWEDYIPSGNGNTDFLDVSCVWCNESSSPLPGSQTQTPWVPDQIWQGYTPSGNGNTDVIDVGCFGGCGTSYPTYPTYVQESQSSPIYPTYPAYVPEFQSYPTYPLYSTPSYPTYPTYPSYPTTPVITTPTTPVIQCSDGLPRNSDGSCTRTTVVPVTQVTRCADGYAPVNNSCTRTNTIPVVTNNMCSDGYAPTNGSCVRNNTIPTVVNNVCSDGLAPVNGSCVRTNVIPTTTYQTCWDGTTIPLYSVCSAQYKVCANGTSIPVNQTCYYGNSTIAYTPPTTIKFNNVITSVATEITNTSARCNGIGLIASGAQSTGWFEYGETANLGRETAKANIGTSATAPFSNKLINLKSSTTYYCRAVMQNQYGTVKGEIVAFKTKSNTVAYVKPAVKTTTTTVVKKPVVKKNEVICVDGQVVTVSSKSAADLLNSGEKLVSMQLEKTQGNLSAGSQVSYRLTFKNLSDETLRGMVVKVVLPAEIVLTNAQIGTYDPTTRTLTIMQPTLAPYQEGSVSWTGTVANDAPLGKSIVTTAYTSYEVPGANAQDEVTAYTVGSIVQGTDTGTTGAKKVIGASTDRGFLPDSLVEWLALIAILFIIFILGRSVYASYSNDKKAAH
ncbi:MAG: hypothetical protein RIQ41_507 [Candidatus Parcubacteria bacterium]